MKVHAKSIMLALCMLTAASAVSAAPFATMSAGEAPAALSLVVPVHGCHRNAQDSIEGWHRHVGPYCRPVASGPAERNPYARCRTRCQYVGPIKQCRRVCDY